VAISSTGDFFVLQRDHLFVGERGEGVVADELQELLEAGAAAVVGGLQEPGEIGGARVLRPAGFQHAERAGVLDLLFLRRRGLDQRDRLGGDGWRLEIDERLAEQPVQLARRGGETRVELREYAGDGRVVGAAEADEADLVRANERDLLLVREAVPIQHAERGEDHRLHPLVHRRVRRLAVLRVDPRHPHEAQ
jgi:hypothetical protein